MPVDPRNELKAQLDALLARRADLFKAGADVVLLHLYWGGEPERGAMRVTSVLPSQHWCDQLGSTGHSDAFQRHISHFGARFTLLRWLSLYCKQLRNQQEYQGLERFIVHFELSQQQRWDRVLKREDTTLNVAIKYPSDTINALWPQRLWKPYRDAIYGGGPLGEFITRAVMHRGAALHGLSDESMSLLADLGRVYVPATPPPGEVPNFWWAKQFINAFQSAWIYFCMFSISGKIPFGFWFWSAITGFKEELPMATLVAFGSSEITPPEATDIFQSVVNISHQVITILNCEPAPLSTFDLLGGTIPGAENLPAWRDLQSQLDAIFSSRHLSEWRLAVARWMACLIGRLRQQVHEGQELGFWFAFGDQTEVEDSGKFKLERIQASDLQTLAVPCREHGNNQDLKLRLQMACEAAARENYHWFQGGRYALFWDVSFARPVPVGLLRLRESHWEWYAGQWEGSPADGEDLPSIEHGWPGLVLAYVRPGGSGGMLVVGKSCFRVFQLPNIVERDKTVEQWLIGAVSEFGDASNKLDVGFLSALCVRIADDPRRGGCVVLLRPGCSAEAFPKMGQEWNLDPPLRMDQQRVEDLIGNMSTDGATCIYYSDDQWKISFRHLLVPDPQTVQRVLPVVQDRLRSGAECFLRGAGSRRWSALLGACHPSVAMALVLCQDQDIFCFSLKGDRLVMEKLDKDGERKSITLNLPSNQGPKPTTKPIHRNEQAK